MIGDRHKSVSTWAYQVVSALAIAALVVGCGGSSTNVAGYKQTKLVANNAGVAPVTDPHLLNAWGIAHLASPGTNSANVSLMRPAGVMSAARRRSFAVLLTPS